MLFCLAWRNLWRHRRRTLITLSSIALGMAFSLFLVSLAEGVYQQLIHDVARMQAGHVTLEHPEYREAPAVDLWLENPETIRHAIDSMPEVKQTKMLVLGQGVARSGTGAVGISVMGIEPSVEKRTSPLAERMIQGQYLDDADTASALVGARLAERLHLAVGKKFVLTTNRATGEMVEDLFRVKGIFRTGSDEIDGYLLQAPIGFVRELYGLPPESVTQLGVLLHRSSGVERVIQRIRELTKGSKAAVHPWWEVLPALAAYIRIDRGSNLVFQSLLLFLILFTIFNTILMSVLERKHEFAVSLALGTPPTHLRLLVLVESVFLAVIGIGSGLAIGGTVAAIVRQRGIDLSGILSKEMTVSGYAISLVLRPSPMLWMFVGLGGLLFLAILLMSLIPMNRAAQVPIVETLR